MANNTSQDSGFFAIYKEHNTKGMKHECSFSSSAIVLSSRAGSVYFAIGCISSITASLELGHQKNSKIQQKCSEEISSQNKKPEVTPWRKFIDSLRGVLLRVIPCMKKKTEKNPPKLKRVKRCYDLQKLVLDAERADYENNRLEDSRILLKDFVFY